MHLLRKTLKANGMKIRQMQILRQEPKSRYTKILKLLLRVPHPLSLGIMAIYWTMSLETFNATILAPLL
jgi:hypothetical protein